MLQFQTADARRAFWVLAAWAPVLPGAMWLGGAMAGDPSVSPAFYVAVLAIEYACVAWWAARRRRLGLFIGPTGVRVGPVVPNGDDVSYDLQDVAFEIRADAKLARLWVSARREEGRRVTAMLLARGGHPGHRLLGGANRLLVRRVSETRGSGDWEDTGVVWTDGNGDAVVAYLEQQVEEARATEAPE